ncbi:hypothetical protein BUALT_Bualt04G0176300 [Buddleja alternifolia]|uniref:Uncharacterized protein n=1 Tax=Buddleja alternifolia TaxID=168488 RepID=A0AAV6XXX1_9LAMI|nr:hypothetical protein BUALT_Bualt04G0176300 [Buddleja alternifolia]
MGSLKSENESTENEIRSLKSEISCTKQEPTSPDASSVSQLKEKNNSSLSEFGTHNLALNSLTPLTRLNIPVLKYEENRDVEIHSPDYSLWESIFSDQLEGADFMMCSPVRRNSPSPLSPNYNYNYAPQVMQVQSLAGCSSPRFLSPLGPNKGKVLSPLKRVLNSPNNQFMTVQQVESLSIPALENAYNHKDDKSSDCFDDLSGVHELLDCLTEPNSTRFSGSDEQQLHQQNQIQNTHNTLTQPILVPQQENDSGLQLVHLLLACAEAVSKEDYMLARRYLHQLNQIVSPLGDSMQRVAACFTEALSARLAATLNKPSISNLKPFNPLPTDNLEILKIYQILYQACPYIKFAHFTANQAIFEAVEAEDRVHVIDLDILQGYQWPAFMQALAARPGGAPFLRITGVGPSAEAVKETGRCLAELAHSLHVPFKFQHIGEELEDLKPHMFNRRVGEALAVNSVNRLHRVPGNSLGNLLTMIRDQAPNIVTIVEQEASHNGPYFLGRFLEALHYYSAFFDSLDATFPPDSAQRAMVEQHILAPEIRNIVAHEGLERVMRHERLEKWRKFMEGKGFQEVPLSTNAVTQSRILLGSYSCDGYRLTEDKGCLLLGWQDRVILAASAWRC